MLAFGLLNVFMQYRSLSIAKILKGAYQNILPLFLLVSVRLGAMIVSQWRGATLLLNLQLVVPYNKETKQNELN